MPYFYLIFYYLDFLIFIVSADDIREKMIKNFPNKYDVFREYLSQITTNKREIEEEVSQMINELVIDQIRNFPLLCKYLGSPNEVRSQTSFNLTNKALRQLVGIFYEIDEIIIRELLGNKFKTTSRKGLEMLAEKISKPYQNIKRGHDNLRNVYKLVVEMRSENQEYIPMLQEKILISADLAERYIRIIFICYHRFETSKQRLLNVTLTHFILMAGVIMENLCLTSGKKSLELDKGLLETLKSFKTTFTKEAIEEYKNNVIAELKNLNAEKSQKIDREFGLLIKNIVSLAAKIAQIQKEKDFFLVLVEKIRQVVREKMELSTKELRCLFRVLIGVFNPSLGAPQHWASFLKALNDCLRIIYKT